MSSAIKATLVACWAAYAHADFTACLGIEMKALITKPSCMEFYSVCEVGVNKLNQKLGNVRYEPVSIISAIKTSTETDADTDTRIEMLVQLAPFTDCNLAVAATQKDSCKRDMLEVQFYSIRLGHGSGADWKLEGYKRLMISDEDRRQISNEYNSKQLYRSKHAIGIFGTSNLLFESNSEDTAPWTPLALVAVSIIALVCLGLVLLQRKRARKDYAPIQH